MGALTVQRPAGTSVQGRRRVRSHPGAASAAHPRMTLLACAVLLLLAWTSTALSRAVTTGPPYKTASIEAATVARRAFRDGTHVLDAPNAPPVPDLVDVLSRSENHTILVRLLQRTRLVPTLILLQELGDGRGLSIFAPTDDAIVRKAHSDGLARMSTALAGESMAQPSSSSFLAPEYIEGSIAPRTPWEWALWLATSQDGDGQKNDEEAAVVPIWYEDRTQLDNINSVLRQQLLYHMINYTLPYNISSQGVLEQASSFSEPAQLPDEGKATLLTTLHLPSRRFLHGPTRPGHVPQPPSSPPHPGSEDRGGLLGGEGQKLRLARVAEGKGRLAVGTNAKGENGVNVVAADWTSPKGVVISIDGVIDLPPSLSTVLKTDSRLQHLLNLTTTTALHSLTETAHATFLLPVAEAFEVLSTIELTFLMGKWDLAAQDRVKLFGEHISGVGVGSGQVAYGERLRDIGLFNLTTIFGGQISVNASQNDALRIGKARAIEEDILIENGVIHIVDRLLLPYGDLDLSVEKTLLALNASRWVSLMHKSNMAHYIDASPHGNDDPDQVLEPWTFMVPRDDVLQTWLDERTKDDTSYFSAKWGYVSEAGDEAFAQGDSLENTLKYHIAPQMLEPQNLTDGMLIGTELRGWKLKDARQRVLVGVGEDAGSSGDRQGNGDVGFGDANVIATPVRVGRSIIYLISQILAPPSNPIQTAVSTLALSTFVATVFSAELDRPIKRAPAVTYLVPHNDAFSALGLAMPYLLLDQQTPRSELRSVVEYHAIDRIVYVEDFASGSRRYPTLEGSSIWAGRDKDGTVDVRRGREGRNAHIVKGDLLTSTGVLHEIDQVELPPTLDLTIEKLMKGAKADTMRDLMQQAGYGWILNGTIPTEEQVETLVFSKFPDKGDKKKKRDKKRHKHRHKLFGDHGQSYVVLCPTDSAFTRVNLTHYYEDREALMQLVQMHIIPSPKNQVLPGGGSTKQLPLSLRDEGGFATLLDASLGGLSSYGKIAFRKLAPAKEETSTGFSTALGPREEEPGLGWMVGVADTRGTDGRKTSARVLNFGRESLSSERDSSSMSSLPSLRSQSKGDGLPSSESVGGILTIDAVLHPYTPGWFYRWGWIAALCTALALVLTGVGYGVWVWWHRDGRVHLPEALEGEEE